MQISKQIEQEKQKFLKVFLNNAPFEGWSIENLRKSAKQIEKEEAYIYLLFPNGIKDLSMYFHQYLNQKMEELFTKQNNVVLKTHEKVKLLIEKKFETYNQYKEAIRNFAKYNLSPINMLNAKEMLWETCDKIWRLAGDESTDFNYYSKRGILAAVYTSSFLYFLNDDSEDFNKTRSFISVRIKNALSIGKFKQKISSLLLKKF